jgi:Protein of unknown function (DUF433)
MTDPRFQSGAPVFKDDPRMPVQTVLDNLDDGMTPEQVAKAWDIELLLVAGCDTLQKAGDLRVLFDRNIPAEPDRRGPNVSVVSNLVMQSRIRSTA